MKKYKIGGSYLAVIISIIFIVISSISGYKRIQGMMDNENNNKIIITLLFLALVIIVFIIIIIQNLVGIRRKEVAYTGNKTMGKIVEVKERTSTSSNRDISTRYIIKVSYKTEYGIDAIFETTLIPSMSIYFTKDKIIPLYVKGNYAYFKYQEVIDFKEENKEEPISNEIENICPYCGAKLSLNTKKCEKCGSKFF